MNLPADIYAVIQKAGGEATRAHIRESLGMAADFNDKNVLGHALRQLAKQGLIKRKGWGTYCIAAPFPERNVYVLKGKRMVAVKVTPPGPQFHPLQTAPLPSTARAA